MPKLDPTITLSVIVALCAIISPVLTTWLNNRHQYKMKELEMAHANQKSFDEHRRKIFDDYLSAAGILARHSRYKNESTFGTTATLAYCYAPPEARTLMEKFELQLSTRPESQEGIALLNEIAITLAPKEQQPQAGE